MRIACFVSGSGTNYAQIAARNPNHDYYVFTNRPGCGAVALASANGHRSIELSHEPYLSGLKERYGAGKIPRNCPERVKYEQDATRLIEETIGRKPDLICLAGYDLWTTDWMVGEYYPRMLNVHPGDTIKGYVGLHWIPSAQAILAGDEGIRSTLFIVDETEDAGPVLLQSKPLPIVNALKLLESKGAVGLFSAFHQVIDFAHARSITTYDSFRESAGSEEKEMMKRVCEALLPELKVAGDWDIFPLAVQLIAEGRVTVDGKNIFVDGQKLPPNGYSY